MSERSTERLLRLLSLLQARREWTGPGLADRLGVSTRTIRKDMERLRRLGYPVHATRGVRGGYRLGPGAQLPTLVLDDEEAVAVAVALGTAAGGSVAGIEESAARALVKVREFLPAPLRHRVGALEAFLVTVPGTGPTVDSETLAVIAMVCRDAVRLRFDYRRHDGTSSRRDVEPHRVVHIGWRWYLVGWDVDQEAWRTFRVDRMSIPRNHRGPGFTPRSLPDGDVGEHVAKGAGTALWNYQATVTAHAPAQELVSRLPPAVQVAAIDDHTCRLQVGSETPQMLAFYLGMLDADFDIEDVETHPQLVEHLRTVARRYQRAATVSDGGDRTPATRR